MLKIVLMPNFTLKKNHYLDMIKKKDFYTYGNLKRTKENTIQKYTQS